MTLQPHVPVPVPVPVPTSSGRRKLPWGWLAAAGFVVLLGVHMRWPHAAAGPLSMVTVSVCAAVVACVAVRRLPAGRRFGWACIATSLALYGIGYVIFLVGVVLTGGPPTVVSIVWLASVLSFVPGLLALLVERDSRRRIDVDGLIDMGSYMILSIIVVSHILDLGSIVDDASLSLTAQLVWLPIADATLLAVLVRGLISRRLRQAAGIWLCIGIGTWLLTDFLALSITSYEAIGSWLDVGWMVAPAAIATAAWQAMKADWSAPPETLPPVTGARVLIGLAPLVLPGLILSLAYLRGEMPNPIPLLGASVALIALAFLRARRLVSVRDRQQADLETGRRYYHALANNSADAVIVLDGHDLIMNDTPHLAAMLGRSAQPTVGADVVAVLAPVDDRRLRATLARMRSAPGILQTELLAVHGDGSQRWLAARSVNLSADPAIQGLVVNLHDVTDRKRAEGELTHRAFHDSLTGLANRALFRDRVEHALRRTSRSGGDMAVMYLDVDGFKTVNDSRGHEAGDEVLREIAGRLTVAVRTADTVARLGGDEFAVLIEESAWPLDEAGAVADRILQALTVPIRIGDQHAVLSASIGVAISDGLSTASTMLRDADVAMYQAKTTGKGRWVAYDPQMRSAAVDRLELESGLVDALANSEFRLVYQPIIELETEEVVGFEALLRWQHPTRGLLAPDAFLPILETNGAIVEVGHWVLVEACETAATWQALRTDRRLTMAVNLSGRQLADPSLVVRVTDALTRSGFPADQLVLEMTEGVLMQDVTTTADHLDRLHALNVRLAIDDFGTGYSSLSYLRRFPVDILKIDRSFVNSITDRAQVPAIVRGLLDLGKTLRLETVAEGIELEEQLDSLRDEHCEFGQGFLFAKPLAVDEARSLLTQLPHGPRPSLI